MEFKYIELFAGIGGFRQALDRLGGKCVFASEIDKHAAKSYEVIYGEMPAGDITKIDADDIPDHDLLTAGFPCQAFSVAGQRKGFEDTRGTLFFEIVRIAKEKRPKVLLLENVKGLINHGKGETLRIMLETLCGIGYTVDFDVLNSKFFGVPQNRERVFIIAIRDDLITPEPWTNTEGTSIVPRAKLRLQDNPNIKTFNFDYPAQIAVTTRVRDILETEVNEKYYLSDERTAALLAQLEEKDKTVGTVGHHPFSKKYEFNGYNSEISPSLIATDYKAPKTVLEAEPRAHIKEYSENDDEAMMECDVCGTRFIGLSTPCPVCNAITVSTRIFREEVRPVLTPDRFKEDGEESFTLTAQDRRGVALGNPPKYRIRKLTPLEYWRLQGFPDEAHERVKQAGISDSQRYKQAGNAVTVNVVEAIGRRLIPMFKLKGGDQHDYQSAHMDGVNQCRKDESS